MAYQKCPLCGGTGKIQRKLEGTAIDSFQVTCHACNGAGIIDEFTGLPPSIQKAKQIKIEKVIKSDINK